MSCGRFSYWRNGTIVIPEENPMFELVGQASLPVMSGKIPDPPKCIRSDPSMNTDLKRYELFGWAYELYNPLSEEEMAWYSRFADRTGGPGLELACGTGRLLMSIAREGYETVGIDLSMNMLRLARERTSRLPLEVQKRIQLCNADMANFQLNRKFGLIFVADNSFRGLKTKEQHLSCLRCVHHHLRPGGRFLMTERRFDPSRFVNGSRAWPWSEPVRRPETGDLVRRRIETQLAEDRKSIRGTMFYKTTYADGSKTMDECPFEAPVMLKDDYISLFSEVGFSTSVFVGYEEQEDDGKHPVLCFACSKR
jgi:SAM-dependent methyltransferase